jgi:hypothetical protein
MKPSVKLDAGLEPVVVVHPQHEAGLVIELGIVGGEGQFGAEIAFNLVGVEVPVVVAEAVEGVVPEVGLACRLDGEYAVFVFPDRRFVVPGSHGTLLRVESRFQDNESAR